LKNVTSLQTAYSVTQRKDLAKAFFTSKVIRLYGTRINAISFTPRKKGFPFAGFYATRVGCPTQILTPIGQTIRQVRTEIRLRPSVKYGWSLRQFLTKLTVIWRYDLHTSLAAIVLQSYG
jgi:hypothetical protein